MHSIRPKPTFLIAGAARSGSTALYDWLKKHPQVFMSPVKETNYFAGLQRNMQGPGDEILNRPLVRRQDGSFEERGSAIVTSWEEYLDIFSGSEHFLARGEASPAYLYYSGTAQSIKACLPDCKLVFILRDPVDRAFSAYRVLRWWGRETLEFEMALSAEDERRQVGWEHIWAYKGMGLYASQIEAYLEIFPREQLGIWLFDQLKSDPRGLYSEVCRFIGLDDAGNIDFSQSNESYGKIGWFKRLWDRLPQTKPLRRKLLPAGVRDIVKSLDRKFFGKSVVMKSRTRAYLRDYFHDDIVRLSTLLPELDVESWLWDTR